MEIITSRDTDAPWDETEEVAEKTEHSTVKADTMQTFSVARNDDQPRAREKTAIIFPVGVFLKRIRLVSRTIDTSNNLALCLISFSPIGSSIWQG